MKIGEIVVRSGVPAKTIRFWEAERLLADPARTPSGYRDYGASVVERLSFIRHAQSAGLTLEQIRQILDISDAGDAPCVHVRGLVERRIAEVAARITELEATRARLEVLAGRAAAQDPADCHGLCVIIQPPPTATGPLPVRREGRPGEPAAVRRRGR
jgi:DNA-binding transcriptional MerR regulator